MNVYKFPPNFRWGSATSAHQVEGNNRNDWTEWEHAKSRVESLRVKGLNPENFISGKACNSYHRYEEDFDIAKKLNQNIHRFSIEWSRIEPEEGRFDSEAMQHYINIVKSLRDRGIEPMITLWHFTNPIWFAEKGGFLNLDSSKYFKRYVKYVVDNLKNQVSLWITFNEAGSVYPGFSYLFGLWPPQEKNIFKMIRFINNITKAHVEAYRLIKEIYGQSPVKSFEVEPLKVSEVRPRKQNRDMSHNVMVGLTTMAAFVVYGKRFYEKLAGRAYEYFRNYYFLDKTSPYSDFIGIDYYHVDRLNRLGRLFSEGYDSLPKQDWMDEMGWEFYPRGIYDLIMKFSKTFNKPIFVTENGIADSTDQKRAKFIKDHLYWIWRAIQDGADVRGYLYWSLLDNFEWHHGFTPRFGLVEVKYDTFERRIRSSAWEYARICGTNSLEY